MDEKLRDILKAYLRDGKSNDLLLEGFNAPLGSLSMRATMTHALGLVSSKEYNEISILRKVRNKFAHEVQMCFEDQSVADLCSNLQFAARGEKETPRSLYTTSAVRIILNLTNRPNYVHKEKCTENSWPY